MNVTLENATRIERNGYTGAVSPFMFVRGEDVVLIELPEERAVATR